MAHCIDVNLVTQQTVDKDELFICPFDPVHRISAKRYVYHIIKCRKNHPHLETATCPFNARHVFLKPELRHHTSICPDRKAVEIELNSLGINELSNGHASPSNQALDFGDDEDWNDQIAQNKAPITIDPFSTKNETFSRPGNHVQKVNTRREAIKEMKERMKQDVQIKGQLASTQALAGKDVALRRPNFAVGGKARVFATSYASMSAKSNASVNGPRERDTLPPNHFKPGARLAANFNMLPKSPLLAAVGRGRGLQLDYKSPVEPKFAVVDDKCIENVNGHAIAEDSVDPDNAESNTEWGFEVVRNKRKKTMRQRNDE